MECGGLHTNKVLIKQEMNKQIVLTALLSICTLLRL